MQCFIYKSHKKDDFSVIPTPLLNSLGQLQFVMELKLTPERKLAREDVNKVIDCLKRQKYFVQLPPTLLPHSLSRSNSNLH